jgi:hypothetical protein
MRSYIIHFNHSVIRSLKGVKEIMEQPISFSIIGGAGFRAQAYLRIAQALPERFRVSGMVVRDPEKGAAMEKQWNVACYRSIEELLAREEPAFVVISAGKGAGADYIRQLSEQGIPVLLETPPASNLESLLSLHESVTLRGARVQVAEQYHLFPMHAARLALIEQGALGRVTETTVSITQLYHAVSLIRKMLGIGFEDAMIQGMRFESPQLAGPGRAGPPPEERLVASPRDIAWLRFGDKLGIYDFTKDQHRSWIRSNHLSIRGDRGELFDSRLNMLDDFRTPLHLELKRVNRGEEENLEGYFLQGIIAGGQYVYTNPFVPARLLDDELAIASCLEKMAVYAAGGDSFYSLPEASQDQYLGMLIEEAIESGKPVQSVRQPWADPV